MLTGTDRDIHNSLMNNPEQEIEITAGLSDQGEVIHYAWGKKDIVGKVVSLLAKDNEPGKGELPQSRYETVTETVSLKVMGTLLYQEGTGNKLLWHDAQKNIQTSVDSLPLDVQKQKEAA